MRLRLIALGRLDEAEAALDRVIALKPSDGDAWYNRATLRRQTLLRNHVPQLQARLRDVPGTSPERTALGYALAKELEDLGEYAQSFAALKQGADLRRSRLRYRVEDDIETMQLIAEAFDADFFATPHAGHADERPLFIVGLPRSGTTLVDRILSSHSAVLSRGETSDLAMALVRTAGPSRARPTWSGARPRWISMRWAGSTAPTWSTALRCARSTSHRSISCIWA